MSAHRENRQPSITLQARPVTSATFFLCPLSRRQGRPPFLEVFGQGFEGRGHAGRQDAPVDQLVAEVRRHPFNPPREVGTWSRVRRRQFDQLADMARDTLG